MKSCLEAEIHVMEIWGAASWILHLHLGAAFVAQFHTSPIDCWTPKHRYSHWHFVDILSGSGDFWENFIISPFMATLLDYWMVMKMPFHSPGIFWKSHQWISLNFITPCGFEMATKRLAWGNFTPPLRCKG